ncbi:DUF4867 family protein [Anaeromicropila populeti]|uniref:DUF4867 domain-containing protein n=1 Tax=Anaeromicropila populeti TaxID=37658 RepID=A0A1I6LU62_9FIRM|nr:DUF4867 family protein [Anaeromicropila populeti]SFS07001.1 protein of unknown function [Anaeromicropila populeti]
MDVKIQKVTDPAFQKYGRVLTQYYDLSDLLEAMENTPLPDDVIYEPSVKELEALPIYKAMTNSVFGGLPIQIGYCNGHNHLLNALEYHRSSEINVAVTDLILLIGSQQDIEEDYTYDTSKVEAFFLPAGTMAECYGTTLHYAPCGVDGNGFRCVVVLPKDTNLPLEEKPMGAKEDSLLTARNKWLIAHQDAGIENAFAGLKGKNISVK